MARDFSGSQRPKITSSGGRTSARPKIGEDHAPASAEIWHLVLTSDISVKEGRAYEASFTAKATTETDFELLLQKSGEPYTTFGIRKVTVGPEPVPVHIHGTAPFSTVASDPGTVARIVLALGKAPAGAEISLVNFKFREIPLRSEPARVTVDFARKIDVPSLTGFLLGLDVKDFRNGPPDESIVLPLRPRFWRVRSEWAERVAGWGAKPIVLCSEGRYPPATAPWADGFTFWREHVTSLARHTETRLFMTSGTSPTWAIFFSIGRMPPSKNSSRPSRRPTMPSVQWCPTPTSAGLPSARRPRLTG